MCPCPRRFSRRLKRTPKISVVASLEEKQGGIYVVLLPICQFRQRFWQVCKSWNWNFYENMTPKIVVVSSEKKNNKGFWIRWPLSFFVVCFLYHPICVVLWYINLDIAGLQILWKMTFTDTLVKIGYLLQTFVKHSMAISKIGVNKTYFLVTFLSAKTNWIFISIVFKLQRNTMCQPPGVSYKLAQLEHEETFIRHNWNWKLEKKKHSKVITSVCNTILTESIF